MKTNKTTFMFSSENNIDYIATIVADNVWEITSLKNDKEGWPAFTRAVAAAFFAELGKENISISYDEIADVFIITIKD